MNNESNQENNPLEESSTNGIIDSPAANHDADSTPKELTPEEVRLMILPKRCCDSLLVFM